MSDAEHRRDAEDRPAAEDRPPAPSRRLRLGQLLARLFVLSGLLVAASALAAVISYRHLIDERETVVHRLEPANLAVSQLLAGYLDQETGVRGYVLTREQLFLQPYESGQATVAAASKQLAQLFPPGTRASILLATVERQAEAWQSRFAAPAVASVASGGFYDSNAELTLGRTLFDTLRGGVAALRQDLADEESRAASQLTTSSRELAVVMIVTLAVVVMNGAVIWVSLRRLVVRPVASVAADARVVSGGELSHRVRPTGPRELAELAGDIEAMRLKIVAEVQAAQESERQLAALNNDLARSNEDLEQFAYVASHDLQEPLRKVTSFCQLLAQRYENELDERGRQYIDFAVDGAKRMQVLINDLLAFSRIGRTTEEFEPVSLAECAEAALKNLAVAIETAGADIRLEGQLPAVLGDRGLLVALFQNLIGNAVKFRSGDRPTVTVAATSDETEWTISVADDGIGIEPRFAERIFVIFQRLHGRDAYTGTGIGLAMCRKIVEFHGGRIWLDVDHHPGTRFCFTLPRRPDPPPVPQEEEDDEHDKRAVNAG